MRSLSWLNERLASPRLAGFACPSKFTSTHKNLKGSPGAEVTLQIPEFALSSVPTGAPDGTNRLIVASGKSAQIFDSTGEAMVLAGLAAAGKVGDPVTTD